MGYKIAVVGATGNVGREMLEILREKQIPVSEIVAIASTRSIGKEVSFGDFDVLKIQSLENYDFRDTDIALFSCGSEISKKYAPIAANAGCVVIDNSSCFRMDDQVPLIVPEVNLEHIGLYKIKNIIANPNCSTIQMVMSLKPIHDLVKIKRVVVSTYQSVSGAGKSAMDELYNQTKGIYVFNSPIPSVFPKQIAFNIIPQIDNFLDDGNTREEHKMIAETAKILDKNIKVSATCVRVPVFIGHSLSLNIELESKLSASDARNALKKFPGIKVVDDHNQDDKYITPIETLKDDNVFVSRIREDKSVKYGLNMWVVSDNLRKGAALNAVQIAQELINLKQR